MALQKGLKVRKGKPLLPQRTLAKNPPHYFSSFISLFLDHLLLRSLILTPESKSPDKLWCSPNAGSGTLSLGRLGQLGRGFHPNRQCADCLNV